VTPLCTETSPVEGGSGAGSGVGRRGRPRNDARLQTGATPTLIGDPTLGRSEALRVPPVSAATVGDAIRGGSAAATDDDKAVAAEGGGSATALAISPGYTAYAPPVVGPEARARLATLPAPPKQHYTSAAAIAPPPPPTCSPALPLPTVRAVSAVDQPPEPPYGAQPPHSLTTAAPTGRAAVFGAVPLFLPAPAVPIANSAAAAANRPLAVGLLAGRPSIGCYKPAADALFVAQTPSKRSLTSAAYSQECTNTAIALHMSTRTGHAPCRALSRPSDGHPGASRGLLTALLACAGPTDSHSAAATGADDPHVSPCGLPRPHYPMPFGTWSTTGAPPSAGVETTTGAKPTSGTRDDTPSVAAGLTHVDGTTAGDKAVSLLVRLPAAVARGDAVQRPADFILTREAAIGVVVDWRQVVAAHAAAATARSASVGAVGDPREARRAADDLTELRGVARTQKTSLDTAVAASQGLLERPNVKNVTYPQEARPSPRRRGA